MWRSVIRATGVPRPAKPARQTGYARALNQEPEQRLVSMNLRGRSRGCVNRACLACRAGFAGRGTPVARITGRHMLASPPDPRRSLGSD